MIPDFIDEGFANVLAAIAEGVIGVALLTPKFRAYGGLGFMALMTGFSRFMCGIYSKMSRLLGARLVQQ